MMHGQRNIKTAYTKSPGQHLPESSAKNVYWISLLSCSSLNKMLVTTYSSP